MMKQMISMPSRAIPGYTRTGGFYGRFRRFGPELKFLDTQLNGLFDSSLEIMSTGGQINLIPQGDTQSQRIGRKVLIKSIYISGFVVANSLTTAAAPADICHMWVVLDTQCNGSAFTPVDANNGLFTGNANGALRTLSNSNRFKILKHFAIPMKTTAGVTTAWGNDAKNVQWFKKCSIPIEFDASATTGAITTIRSNNISIVIGSAGLTDDVYAFSGNCRIRYADA